MARKAGTSKTEGAALEPGVGHNSTTMTDEDREKLFIRDLDAVEAAKRELEAAQAVVKARRKNYNRARNEMSGDGFPLVIVDEILKDQDRTEAELIDFAENRHWMREKVGLPNGGQRTLHDRLAEPAKDEIAAEADGWRAGRRALERKPPAWVHPSCHQAWLKKYDEGQARNAWAKDPGAKTLDGVTPANSEAA